MSETEMFREHQKLVHHVLKGFVSLTYTTFFDYDDLVQIGGIALLKAIRNFDPSKGFEFSTFAVPIIENQLRRLIYTQNLQKNQRPPSVPLDAPISTDDDSATLADLIGKDDPSFNTIDAKLIWQKLSGKLSGRDSDILLSRVVEGATLKQISKRYKQSQEWVRQRYNAIVGRLRNQA